MDIIAKNINIINQRIQTACNRSNRNLSDVRMLLATKTVDTNRINFALAQGVSLIGENKVQELKEKCSAVCHLNPEVHFIGHLQTNKIKEVLKWASCIESIDRISLAKKLHQRLRLEKKEIDVYIQVNTSFEESKFGIAPNETIDFIREVAAFDTIHIKGLMTIGLLSSDSKEVRKCFRLLKELQKKIMALKIPNVDIKELSMGMSSDLEIAIEEGATIIRVGTAIFGDRTYPDSYYWNENE
ncbi:YggS family pyridoxal phosphate-dependent enzyme [Aquimarina sp. AD10]|uniref:YggS family pyridoxal phosphate-dependent enzyme n=1 Tax=Aquimarina sp. AD10 TaxID=1714849 RepID=UPI000E4E7B9D|nr:YggS family pyridoxal phosphate-dependent enzyme [Aquimarina sp. AD10]AXT61094.1 YggS family pyridoxal phosphate-dependent enzyme [Aquimarina sp. AD10]RKM92149.1 YggS family pyridoxal phosphate-dependent enzyme [Aquimarina sp. AD10]